MKGKNQYALCSGHCYLYCGHCYLHCSIDSEHNRQVIAKIVNEFTGGKAKSDRYTSDQISGSYLAIFNQ